MLLARPPIPRQWLLLDLPQWLLAQWAENGIVGFGVSALAAYYAMIAVHELGHVLAGLGVGFRFRSLRVGPILFNRPFRVSLYRGPGAAVNGVAELIPVATDQLAWRGVAMVVGGPAANILSAMVVLLLPLVNCPGFARWANWSCHETRRPDPDVGAGLDTAGQS